VRRWDFDDYDTGAAVFTVSIVTASTASTTCVCSSSNSVIYVVCAPSTATICSATTGCRFSTTATAATTPSY
jgi:hypothetical protein